MGLEALLGINPKLFKYNGLGEHPATDKLELGVIAQEVEKTAPELVVSKKVKLHPKDNQTTEIKQVNYTLFIYVVINAVKELLRDLLDVKATLEASDAKIKKLEKENAELKVRIETENAELKNRLEKVEKALDLK